MKNNLNINSTKLANEYLKTGNPNLLTAICKELEGYIESLCHTYTNTDTKHYVEDLQQEANIAIIKHTCKFDSRRAGYLTWISPRLRGAIIDFMRTTDIYSRSYRQYIFRFREYRPKLGTSAKIIARDTDIPLNVVKEFLLHGVNKTISRISEIEHRRNENRQGTDNKNSTNKDLSFLEDHAVDSGFERVLNTDFINQLLLGLKDNERSIMVKYYIHGMTMGSIARELGVSESRVSQQHSNIIKQLRSKVNLSQLKRSITHDTRRPCSA